MSGYNYETFGQCEISTPDFWSVAEVGSQAPDFSLTGLDGRTVTLSSFRGRQHVLLEFGSIT